MVLVQPRVSRPAWERHVELATAHGFISRFKDKRRHRYQITGPYHAKGISSYFEALPYADLTVDPETADIHAYERANKLLLTWDVSIEEDDNFVRAPRFITLSSEVIHQYHEVADRFEMLTEQRIRPDYRGLYGYSNSGVVGAVIEAIGLEFLIFTYIEAQLPSGSRYAKLVKQRKRTSASVSETVQRMRIFKRTGSIVEALGADLGPLGD